MQQSPFTLMKSKGNGGISVPTTKECQAQARRYANEPKDKTAGKQTLPGGVFIAAGSCDERSRDISRQKETCCAQCSSEYELQGKLPEARVARLGDLCKSPRRLGRRVQELGVVEGIEELRAEFNLRALRDGSSLHQR